MGLSVENRLNRLRDKTGADSVGLLVYTDEVYVQSRVVAFFDNEQVVLADSAETSMFTSEKELLDNATSMVEGVLHRAQRQVNRVTFLSEVERDR